MSNPIFQALIVGKVLAEVTREKVEETLTQALSEFGRFDAHQREKLKEFLEEVQTRIKQEEENKGQTPASSVDSHNNTSDDLQETIDELRAEIARLRSELKSYKA